MSPPPQAPLRQNSYVFLPISSRPTSEGRSLFVAQMPAGCPAHNLKKFVSARPETGGENRKWLKLNPDLSLKRADPLSRPPFKTFTSCKAAGAKEERD